jgi:hypothetical protein
VSWSSGARGGLAILLLVVAACGGASDHERLGDQAYGQEDWSTALSQYRLVSGDHAGVSAKTGAAALHAGELRQAA